MTAGSKLLSVLLILSMMISGMAGCGGPTTAQYAKSPEPEVPEPDEKGIEPSVPVEVVPAGPPVPEAEPGPADDLVEEKHDLIHKVKWNRETLYTIALWYTGAGNNWRRLVAENPQINPRRMPIGELVRIPEVLLIRRHPMPVDFLKSLPRQKPEPVHQKPPKPPDPLVAPPLYGPVGDDPPSKRNEGNELPVPLETLDD